MKLRIKDDRLQIELGNLEKMLSIHGSFDIPLENIENVTSEEPETSWKDIRAPGTFFPGLIRAGTYRTPRGKEFWYSTRGKKKLKIKLKDYEYDSIIIGIDDNTYWEEKLNEYF